MGRVIIQGETKKMHRTLEEQIKMKCVHFNGAINKACDVGIAYDTLGRPFPCILWDKDQPGTCEQLRFPTDEEVAARVAEWDRAVEDFKNNLKEHRCVVCGKPVGEYRQVGRCVYASCGHRQYQGTIK